VEPHDQNYRQTNGRKGRTIAEQRVCGNSGCSRKSKVYAFKEHFAKRTGKNFCSASAHARKPLGTTIYYETENQSRTKGVSYLGDFS